MQRLMSNIKGFENSDYATFNYEATETVKQLPSIPIDQVLPQANAEIDQKQVTFSEPIESEPIESLQTIVPSQNKQLENGENQNYSLLADFGIYIVVILMLVAIFYYRTHY